MKTSDPTGLADRLKFRTRELHLTAERSGVTAQILRGSATLTSYALLLASLAPVYLEMERLLAARVDDPSLRRLVDPAVLRHDALTRDLGALLGANWRDQLAPPDESARYVDHVKAAAEGDGARLIAHAYVRYLGDLNGGQALARLLARSLGLPKSALSFYEFPLIEDLPSFREQYRAAIDQAGREIQDPDAVVEEAAIAFQLNIDLSEAVLRAQPIPAERTAADSREALA